MKKITNNTRIYNDRPNRERAVKALRRIGFDYFVYFSDVQGYGLQYGKL